MSIKLLLADDSITIQKVIGIIFGGADYSLTIVDNGKAAVEKASELSPDVLLIDALMPGMTGYEVCETVRAIPALAATPILLLTGSFEPFDEDKAKKCGADDFLAKPFESQQIVNKVKELSELGASRAVGTVSAELSGTSEPIEAFAAPAESIAVPVSAAPPETLPSTTPSDIWGAFTPEPETSEVAAVSTEALDTAFSDFFEPDVFAIVSEESDSQLVQSPDAPQSSHQHTGTQWIPVEEHTFEFEKENVAEIPQAALSDQAIPVQDSAFGEIAFEDGVPAQKVPISKAIIVEPAASDAILPKQDIVSLAEPVATPVTMPAPTTVTATTPTEGVLSEEQLKAAITAVSKEVIERIVWEVVPDLAETMIREAIRKIREGV
jgi:CheY-like chemotaxis protein